MKKGPGTDRASGRHHNSASERSRGWVCFAIIAIIVTAWGCGPEDTGDAISTADATREVDSDATGGLAFRAEGALTIDITEAEWQTLQRYRTLPETLPANPTNAVAHDPGAAALGEQLFFEARLSASGEFSCASCHDPEQGWSDGRATAETIARGSRNTPTLFNVGAQRWFFWDGRADSLWAQALGPIENPIEMGGSRLAVAHLVHDDATLRSGYEAVFGPLPDLSDDARFPADGRPVAGAPDDPMNQAWEGMSDADRETINQIFSNTGKAIAAFEYGITSKDSAFDRFLEGLAEGDEARVGALSAAAQRGLKLFMGEASCHFCHIGPWFTNSEFHNIGMMSPPGPLPDIGRTNGIDVVLQDPFNGAGSYSDSPDAEVNDKLRFLARDPTLTDGAFKTPALRSVALTAPYMHHDGRFESLMEVLEFYNELPEDPSVGHREETLQPLDLSDEALADLEAFLQSLTGE